MNMQQALFDFQGDAANRQEPSTFDSSNPGKVGPFHLDRVYLQDCIEAMNDIPTNSIDVAIADPPYNASKGGNWQWDNSVKLPGFGGDWSKVMAEWDDMPLGDYFNFTISWLAELKRVVKPTGSFWIHGTYHNIGIINFALQLLEIEIINEIVWYKRNSFPNLSGRRLTASHETILWAHTGGPKGRKYHFAYDTAKELDCPEDQLKQAGKQMRTVWDIPNNKKRIELKFGKHPTQKPVRLLRRMLAISAKAGDALLVPFTGAGSDCVAARELGLHFLGFETNKQYVEISNERLNATVEAVPNTAIVKQYVKQSPAETPNNTLSVSGVRFAKTIPSLIKWTGSKRSQANAIARLMPSYQRYFEPFVGGGALLFLAAHTASVAGDIYRPLIELWTLIQSDPSTVIDNYKTQWLELNDELDAFDIKNMARGNGIPKYYYTVRDRFNQAPDALDLNFLMRTCVNGIVRFNDDGQFNNSFHLSRRGMQPQRFANIVQKWSSVLQGVEFVCQDYTTTLKQAEHGDFVYLDPPYAGNKQRYIGDLDLDSFFTELESLNRRGVNWALSFDGRRGHQDLTHDVPKSLYKRQLFLSSGNSAVNKVLNGPVENVEESLYLNY